ncbi:GGDEF domain-containing protein [Desulfovibrio psychrotolerans]|uniref:diguanylate cyclase n=1 Tax=Desulfovibrio psychrotolerans TaxID=415242 RepID=A0A7J0BNV4_9BACT|nr:GGDEF domain-containing protein [Desulfovibrio psychrotolerans]GFM35397.1 hypothetical protein DSM19430T_00810 [Desulfovibrio psychrotolerans]
MRKTNHEGPPTTKGELKDLSGELEQLRRLLVSHAAELKDENCSQQTLVAITRIVPGLTGEKWDELAAAHGLGDWMALGLDATSCANLLRLQKALEELTHQTEHDALTGLANRRAFTRHMRMEMERVERSNGQVSIAVLDIDDFKQVNDTYGHACGDEVLRVLAQVMRENIRAYDVAARIGGEEFALILPGAAALSAKALVERMLEAFRTRSFLCPPSPPFHCTFSCGVSCIRSKSLISSNKLLELADMALYEAKAHGKNRVHVARQQEASFDRSTMVHSNEKQFLFSGTE